VNRFVEVKETKVKFSSDELNNPWEYNVCFRHYREIFLDRMKLTKNKEKFENSIGVNLIEFIDKFFNEMSEANPTFKELIYADKINKKKWLKLIFQLYLELIDYYETNKNREERPLPILPTSMGKNARALTEEEIAGIMESLKDSKIPEGYHEFLLVPSEFK
jgi:hypothetical protein